MYRDDLEAIKARVETLESAVNAERKAREAAQAGEKAARARAEELTLLLQRSHDDPDPPFWRRHGITVVAFVVAIAAVGAFIYQRTRHLTSSKELAELQARMERLHRELVRAEVKHDGLQEKLSRVEWRLREKSQKPSIRVVGSRVIDLAEEEKKDRGYLIANSVPWARIHVDGKDTGLSTPITPRRQLALEPGRHKVTFVTRGGKRFTFPVSIRAGETTKLIKRLH